MRNRRFFRLFEEEIISHNSDADNGGRIRRKRVSLQDDEVKTKDDHPSGVERLYEEVHSRMKEPQKRLQKNQSRVNYKRLAEL